MLSNPTRAVRSIVLSLVGPPARGSYAAARSDARISAPTVELAPLDAPTDGAVTLTEYYTRVLYDMESLDGVRVRLTGFVTPVEGRWFVTRVALSCCAADGRPVRVLTAGEAATPAPPADSWVEVVGTVTEPERLADDPIAVATLQVESIRSIEAPRDPYE